MEGFMDINEIHDLTGTDTEEHIGDGNAEQQVEGAERGARPTISEFKKTWGFRRTTVARREFVGLDETEDPESPPLPTRRGRGRPAQTYSRRGRGGRRSAPADLEHSETGSPTPMDTEPASEALEPCPGARLDPSSWRDFGSAFSTAFSLLGEKKEEDRTTAAPPSYGGSGDMDAASSIEEDSDELTLKQLQERLSIRGRGEARGRGVRGRGRSSSESMPPLESDPEPETKEEKPSQYDNVTEEVEEEVEEERDEVEEEKDEVEERIEEEKSEYSSISDSEGYNPNALYCICRQRQNKRFMISCDNCQEWFHGDCVGVSETHGSKLERSGRDWICPNCTNKSQSQPDPQQSHPDCLTLPSSGEEERVHEEQASKEAVAQEETEVVAEAEMETDSSLPQCIGPGCSMHALPDSVYCGTDCILRHAAATMKTLSDSKETNAEQSPQSRAAAKPGPKGQRSARIPQRLSAERPEDEKEAEEVEDKEPDTSTSPLSCNPSLTAVQATSIESSMFYKSSMYHSQHIHIQHIQNTLLSLSWYSSDSSYNVTSAITQSLGIGIQSYLQ
ncbi:death-inducer obliterator 1-like [Salvelinus namaycush]|uniref:Death-inducer obliterator 1-like n=1 Tax=Salvelinus namaycush TaxID=8040 RepID=A0A8U1BTV7_SALNM|nr:death-inducer obliterator 1-like [Salvelinus namaycush]